MTREEQQQRWVPIQATPRPGVAGPVNVRKREPNYVEKPEAHISEQFDDFFDYEKELTEFTPARDTVSVDIDRFSDNNTEDAEFEPIVQAESESASFIVMEKIPLERPKAVNIEAINEEVIDSNKADNDLPFEFYQCTFLKDDGERCKKQAKKDQDYCGIHKKYVEKNNL